MTSGPGRSLRCLASLLVRGPAAPFVLGDLDEAMRRDVERGISLRRARARYLVNGLASALRLARARVRLPSTGLPSVAFSLLDFKLGFRMLVKYPGLTLVGGLAMAFGIWVAALTFEIVGQIVGPELPLDEGDRIVGVQNVNREQGRLAPPFREDFAAWRDEIRTIGELGAFRSVSRNLIVDGAGAEPIVAAEMSATGFGVARVRPLRGRTLVDADEEPGAPPVVVIGYHVWQSRFAGAPNVVGRTVGVGGATSTVVGVMPEGFAFPISHQVWIPLRRSSVDLQPGDGGRVAVFGRLAPGTTAEEAQAELDVLGARRAAAFPDALGLIRPRVMPYARSVRPLPDVGSIGLLAANVFMLMLLVLICGNVALMMFARAATRTSEIAVRSALGASRSRIVGQLFAEALVLGGIAALVGLVGAGFGMKWYVAMIEADTGGQFPFWIRDQLAPATVLYLCGLTLIGAAVAGVGPALKVTGRRVEPRLRQLAAGSGGLRLSGVWAAVIVAQVAVTVAFPATAFFFQRYVTSMQSLDLGFAAEEYLSVRLEMDGATASGRGPDELQATPEARLAAAAGELEERLANAPDVTGVTFANRLPGDAHPAARLQIEDAGSADQEGLPLHRAATARVDMNFFRVLGAPMHAGRDFDSGDAASDAGVVIVNQAFVDEVLAGRNPVGRRVRYAAQDDESPGRWLEIVGAADDLGMIGGDGEVRNEPGLYHPLAAGEGYPLQMAVHVRTDPDRFAPRLRALAAAVDPNLRLHDVRRLDRVSESRWRESEFLYQLLAGVSVVALILSLTTIYSVMAFTVSRRTREIGVRVALGSNPRRIVLSILLRPLTHVAVGILVGAILVSLVTLGLTGPPSVSELGLVAFYSAVMLGVCLLACIVPTHRALAVEPTEALRADG